MTGDVSCRADEVLGSTERPFQYCVKRGGPVYVVLASVLIASVAVIYLVAVFPQVQDHAAFNDALEI